MEDKGRLILGLWKDRPCFIGENIVLTYIENRGSKQIGIMIEAPKSLSIRRSDIVNTLTPKKNPKRYVAGKKNET